MNDLINRQVAISAMYERWSRTENFNGWGADIGEECEEVLKAMPSAVVRCAECKHWNRGRCWGIPFSGDDASYIETDANDFCSFGERRADDD